MGRIWFPHFQPFLAGNKHNLHAHKTLLTFLSMDICNSYFIYCTIIKYIKLQVLLNLFHSIPIRIRYGFNDLNKTFLSFPEQVRDLHGSLQSARSTDFSPQYQALTSSSRILVRSPACKIVPSSRRITKVFQTSDLFRGNQFLLKKF